MILHTQNSELSACLDFFFIFVYFIVLSLGKVQTVYGTKVSQRHRRRPPVMGSFGGTNLDLLVVMHNHVFQSCCHMVIYGKYIYTLRIYELIVRVTIVCV